MIWLLNSPPRQATRKRGDTITMKIILILCMISCFLSSAHSFPLQDWYPKAPPLPLAQGKVIQVFNVNELLQAVQQVNPGETIALHDGTYYLPRYIEIRTDSVTLRGASGDRDAVIIDGSKSMHNELIGFRACADVTVADLTIQNTAWNGFKINSDDNVQRLTIYNCVIRNIWQRGVKSVIVPEVVREKYRPKDFRIQYCLFYNDHPKRFSDDPSDTGQTFNGNYIGGIDAMYPRGWTISDNVFVNINGRAREGRGCVFLWHHAEDCIIERNIIIDCDVGIALGNSSGIGEGMSSIHATNMIVRNNFITRTPESGILADYTKDCMILNNTIYDPENRMRRLIRIVHDNEGLILLNNLCSGPGISIETLDSIENIQNLIGDFSICFKDPRNGDLHLKEPCPQIVDQGTETDSVSTDIDRHARNEKIDIGADEWKPELTHIH